MLKSFIPRRTWLRFSLGTFLLAVAVIAYGCKWVLDRVKLCAGQYDLLASMSVNGPEYFRRHCLPLPGNSGGEGGRHKGKHIGAFNHGLAAPTGWEKTAADWLGISYEVDVVLLGFLRPRVDLAKDMEVALQMPKLKKFFLYGEPITDDVIAAIKRMNGLDNLSFSHTEIPDSAVAALKGMRGLTTLSFMAADVTEETAVELKEALPQTQILVYRQVSEREYVTAIDLP